MINPRGLTMSRVTHLRQALHQICADEAVPTTTTAMILAEHELTSADVMVACDVLEDVVAEFRRRESEAMAGTTAGRSEAPTEPPKTPPAPQSDNDLRKAIEANRAKVLASMAGGSDAA